MKVAMTDAVSTGYSVFPGFEEAIEIEEQAGVTVTSEAKADCGPGKGRSFVLGFAKGATIDLPDWLANRMINLGFAEVPPKRKRRRIPRF